MADLDTLRMLAGKATPGPWFYRPKKHDDWGTVRISPDAEGYSPFVANVRSGKWDTEDELGEHRRQRTDPFGDNARYIAACDPQTILALLDKIARYEARLEIDHCFVMVDGKEMVRQEIPAEERETWPDGITCRDETIKQLEQQIALSAHP